MEGDSSLQVDGSKVADVCAYLDRGVCPSPEFSDLVPTPSNDDTHELFRHKNLQLFGTGLHLLIGHVRLGGDQVTVM